MTDHFVRVDLLQLPLQIWHRAQEHMDGLLREFTLIAQDDEAMAATPGRLLSLVTRRTTTAAGVTTC